MSDYSNPAVEAAAETVVRFRREAGQNLKEIKENPDLSTEAQNRFVKEYQKEARDNYQAFIQNYNQTVEGERSRLYDTAFSIGSGKYYGMTSGEMAQIRISYANALTAAASMSKEQLSTAINSAILAGDNVTAQAVAAIAYNNGLDGIIDKFAGKFGKEAVEALYQFEATYGSRRSADKKMADKMKLSGPF